MQCDKRLGIGKHHVDCSLTRRAIIFSKDSCRLRKWPQNLQTTAMKRTSRHGKPRLSLNQPTTPKRACSRGVEDRTIPKERQWKPSVSSRQSQLRFITAEPVDLTLITPTGDRPLPMRLCERWISRQTFRGTIQWIVVDDGKTETELRMGQQRIRRLPRSDDPPHTLALNLKKAIPHVASEKVLIIEDDDWYAPNYLEVMSQHLDRFELVGEGHSFYYHLGERLYRPCGNERHASLCQTGFRRSAVLQSLNSVCESTDKFVDLRLWKYFVGKRKVFVSSPGPIALGIKGLPGRPGQTMGWRPKHGSIWKADASFEVLRQFIAGDIEHYQAFLNHV